MTPEQLQANLAEAEAALHNLLIGRSTVTASYAMGDGSRSVTYTAANANQLRDYIRELKQQLGLGRRGAIAPVFG